jgi:hypothetical protein
LPPPEPPSLQAGFSADAPGLRESPLRSEKKEDGVIPESGVSGGAKAPS